MSSADEQTENRLDLNSLNKRNRTDKVKEVDKIGRKYGINDDQTEINLKTKNKKRTLLQSDESMQNNKLKSHITPISDMTIDKLKCTMCMTWQNLYQIFEFITNGILLTNNELEVKASDSKKESIESASDTETTPRQNTLSEMAFMDSDYKIEHLANIVNKLKLPIKNPADPSDSSEWTWNYKSSQHYKLLKLKLNLVSQTNQLIKTYNPVLKQAAPNKRDETKCTVCFTSNKKLIDLKINVLCKLNDYVFDWKPHLERVFDRFKDTRMKANYDINTLNDLNMFLRTPAPIKWFQLNMNSYTTTMKKIDKYSLKAYNLLDLLVGDNFFYNSNLNEDGSLKSSHPNRRNYSSGRNTLSNSFSSNSQNNSGMASNYSTYSKHNLNTSNYERLSGYNDTSNQYSNNYKNNLDKKMSSQNSRYNNSQILNENQYSNQNYYSYKSSRGSTCDGTRSRQSNDYFRNSSRVYSDNPRNLYTSKFSYQNTGQSYISSSVYLAGKEGRGIHLQTSQLNRFTSSGDQNNSSYKNSSRSNESLNFQTNPARSSQNFYNKNSDSYGEYSNSRNLTSSKFNNYQESESNQSNSFHLSRSKSLTSSKNYLKDYDHNYEKCSIMSPNNSKQPNERSRSFSPTTSSKNLENRKNTPYHGSSEKISDVNNNYIDTMNQEMTEPLNDSSKNIIQKINDDTKSNINSNLSGERKKSKSRSRKLSKTIESLSPLSSLSKYSKIKNYEIKRKKKSKYKSTSKSSDKTSSTRESKRRKLSTEMKSSRNSSRRVSKSLRVDIGMKKSRDHSSRLKSSSYENLIDKYQENKQYLSSITSDDSLNAFPSSSSISSSSSFGSSIKSISSEKSLCSISSDSSSELFIKDQKGLKKNLSDLSLTSQSSCSISSIENIINSTKHYKRKLSRNSKGNFLNPNISKNFLSLTKLLKENKSYKKSSSLIEMNEQRARSEQIKAEVRYKIINKKSGIKSSSLMTEIKKNKDNEDSRVSIQSHESEKKLKKRQKYESSSWSIPFTQHERNRPKQTKLIVLSVPKSSVKDSSKKLRKFPLITAFDEDEVKNEVLDMATPLIIIVDFNLSTSSNDMNFNDKCPLCTHQNIKNLEEMSEILPIISHKLSNLNLNDYIDDFNKKFVLIKEYEQVIKKVLSLSNKSQEKYNNYASFEDNITNHEKVNFECKLKLMQRIINECLERLIIQKSYLNQLKEFFDNLNEKCLISEDLEDKINSWVLDIKKSLYISQANLIEYARSSRKDQCLIKNLSFYCLIDILNRFSFIYNIRSIDFASI